MTEIPFALRAINAEQCAELFGCAPRTFLERIACKPGFPMRETADVIADRLT